jgi:hypothetical protein
MTAQILKFVTGPNRHDFGGCPKCHGNNGCLTTADGDHYFICRHHGVKWKFGRCRFPAWLKMGSGSLMRQGMELGPYHEVEAWYPDVKIKNGVGVEIVFTKLSKPLYRWATGDKESLDDRCKLVTEPNDPIFARARNRRR